MKSFNIFKVAMSMLFKKIIEFECGLLTRTFDNVLLNEAKITLCARKLSPSAVQRVTSEYISFFPMFPTAEIVKVSKLSSFKTVSIVIMDEDLESKQIYLVGLEFLTNIN